MVVSWNGGTPKSSILIAFSLINQPFLGTSIYGNPHLLSASYDSVPVTMSEDATASRHPHHPRCMRQVRSCFLRTTRHGLLRWRRPGGWAVQDPKMDSGYCKSHIKICSNICEYVYLYLHIIYIYIYISYIYIHIIYIVAGGNKELSTHICKHQTCLKAQNSSNMASVTNMIHVGTSTIFAVSFRQLDKSIHQSFSLVISKLACCSIRIWLLSTIFIPPVNSCSNAGFV